MTGIPPQNVLNSFFSQKNGHKKRTKIKRQRGRNAGSLNCSLFDLSSLAMVTRRLPDAEL